MDFNKDLSRIASKIRHELANIWNNFSFHHPNPTMHLVLEDQKNANIDNNKQIYGEFNRKITRMSQYLSVKSTDTLMKSEDLYGFHDEILQIF